MSGLWTVRDVYTPLAMPNGTQPALAGGNPFSFRRGEELQRDDDKTENEEKDGVIIRQWFWLVNGDRAGYVPYNWLDPNDSRSPAIELTSDIPPPFEFQLFDTEINQATFAENCVRKAIRWQTNAAYLFALGFVESGRAWPDDKVSSPPASPGSMTIGTFQFLPTTWRTLVDKIGADQSIDAGDIVFPEAQTTFAASQAGDAALELQKKLGAAPTYLDLYLAHLFTNEGCAALRTLGGNDLNKPFADTLQTILAGIDETARAARTTGLLERKKTILQTTGDPLSVSQAIAALEAELDGGFAKVAIVAKALAPAPTTANTGAIVQPANADTLGVLSEEFESQGNPVAIGWDRVGGWSYGKYQLAASKGAVDEFMTFLKASYVDIWNSLNFAGGASAAKSGTQQFKDAFRALKNNPDFNKAQHDFIKATYYDVMVARLRPWFDVNARSFALQNVVWSVAVQHGPKTQIITIAVRTTDKEDDFKLINAIYDERSRVNIYFKNSEPKIRAAVLTRFIQERRVALKMLAAEVKI